MGIGARNPRYEVVFFDLYGTLIDIRTDEQSEAAWQALYDCVTELGAQYESVDVMRDQFEKLEAREMVHQADRAIVRNGWDEFDILPVYRSLLMNRSEEAEKKLALPQAALKAAWAFRQGSTSLFRLYPGALDMIEQLQDAGMVVALLSNAQACYTRPELEETGLASVLDDVIISSEEKIRKPARDLYMLALDREFVTAKHALMVGQRRTQRHHRRQFRRPRRGILPHGNFTGGRPGRFGTCGMFVYRSRLRRAAEIRAGRIRRAVGAELKSHGTCGKPLWRAGKSQGKVASRKRHTCVRRA